MVVPSPGTGEIILVSPKTFQPIAAQINASAASPVWVTHFRKALQDRD